jgi:cell division protein FtsB
MPGTSSRAARTVARARARVAVQLPADSLADNWLRSVRLSGFSILVLLLIVVFVVVLAPGLRIYLEQRQQIADLQANVASQQTNLGTLQDERARWDDPAYIRSQARDRLFYVMPGEYSYLVLDDLGADAANAGAPVSSTLQETKVDWAKSLFSSLITAGLSTETPATVPTPTTPSPTSTTGSGQ